MPNIYSSYKPEKQVPLEPKKETISFLLSFSKALTVESSDKFQFTTLNN